DLRRVVLICGRPRDDLTPTAEGADVCQQSSRPATTAMRTINLIDLRGVVLICGRLRDDLTPAAEDADVSQQSGRPAASAVRTLDLIEIEDALRSVDDLSRCAPGLCLRAAERVLRQTHECWRDGHELRVRLRRCLVAGSRILSGASEFGKRAEKS